MLIEVVGAGAGVGAGGGHLRSLRRQRARARPHLDLSKLGVSPFVPGSEFSREGADGDSTGEALGAGGGFTSGKEDLLHREIYDRIDHFLTYPHEFKEKGFTGTVKAKLYIDSEGNYLRERSVFTGDNPYLRVHVIRVIRQALLEAIDKKLLAGRKSLTVDCTFRFAFRAAHNLLFSASRRYSLNDGLIFYREDLLEKRYESAPSTAFGRTTQGSFLRADFFSMSFEDFGALFSKKKAKAEPLDVYRDDPDW
jgi:hypothetical protein